METLQWRKDKSGKLILQEYSVLSGTWTDVPIVNKPPKTLKEKIKNHVGDSEYLAGEVVSIVRDHMLELHDDFIMNRNSKNFEDVLKSIE